MTYDAVRSGNRILIVGLFAVCLTYALGKSYEPIKRAMRRRTRRVFWATKIARRPMHLE
jgi:hypothetical protein